MIVGAALNGNGRDMLRDLDLDPNIKTKDALAIKVSLMPVLTPRHKGLQLALRF